MDDEWLKQGSNRYFRELLQRIRDIRSGESNLYQQVTDIYATAADYDPRSDITKAFFRYDSEPVALYCSREYRHRGNL